MFNSNYNNNYIGVIKLLKLFSTVLVPPTRPLLRYSISAFIYKIYNWASAPPSH